MCVQKKKKRSILKERHREYTLREMKTRQWLKRFIAFVYDYLQRIVTDKTLLKDLKYLKNLNLIETLVV